MNRRSSEEMLIFEQPHHGLCASYRAFVREFVDAGEALIPFPLAFPNEDFEAFLQKLAGCARGQGLPDGFVAHSTFWLVADGEVVAVSNLRHTLTPALRRQGGNIGYGVRPSASGHGYATAILARTLERAREIGICEAWLTCGKANRASAITIVRNGGELVEEELLPERGQIVQRYRVKLGGQP